MLEKLVGLTQLVKDEKTRDLLAIGGGTALLMSGARVLGLSLFGKGMMGLEKGWRAAHPDFQGNFKERWAKAFEFYEATHLNQTNRWLHIVGIPMILAGTGAMLVATPPTPIWAVGVGLFVVGWALNLVGHKYFEKNAPAFRDDPLSFIAGPVWDFKNLFSGNLKNRIQAQGPTGAVGKTDGFHGATASA